MAFEDLKNAVWVRARLAEGLVNADLARLLGCSPALVCKWLKRHGIESPRALLLSKLNDREWLERVYVTEGRNASQVAGLLGCERSAVLDAARRHGLPVKDASEAQKAKTEHLGSRASRPKAQFLCTLNSKEWLEARLAEGLSVTKIAHVAGSSPPAVSVALEKAGLEPNLPPLATKVVEPSAYKPRRKRNPDAKQAYWHHARRITPNGPCSVTGCGRPGLDVNHKDRNPKNNVPENLERLCRRCHRRQEAAELMVMKEKLEAMGVPFAHIHQDARKRLERGF